MNTRYENFVLENKLKDQLVTSLSMLDYVTIDDSLTAAAGMTKKINVYFATGEAQDVLEGEGNTESIEMSYEQREYVVGTTQARFIYTDEDEMTDPYLVDGGVSKLSESLVNHLYTKVANEYWHATKYVPYTKGTDTVNYDTFVDAIAMLGKERDEDAGLFALISPNMKAQLRKALKDELKYVEANVRTGYIGTVAGVPLSVSKLIPDGCVVIASKKAVTYFRKKNVEVEQDRDKNLRKNIMYGRQVGLVAFTDAAECVIIAPTTTAPTITTASLTAGMAKAITGTCAAGAKVYMLVNGVKVGEAAVAGTAWSYTLDEVKSGDKVTVRMHSKGFAAAEATELTVT